MAREKEPLEKNELPLNEDDTLNPRDEYHYQYVGSSIHIMDNPALFGQYHRGLHTRMVDKVKVKATHFDSPCAQQLEGKNKVDSFYAHTGGITSPFSHEVYAKSITLSVKVLEFNINVRDRLLHYRSQMAQVVVDSFNACSEQNHKENKQKVKKRGERKAYDMRPIVFVENDYYCVLIQFPVTNAIETPWAKNWSNIKPLQELLLASFIAYLNKEAERNKIPIEMVLRSSFGHNLPSICQTNQTFRINVGIVPRVYAELIGRTLYKVNEQFEAISNKPTVRITFDATFQDKLRYHNTIRLKKKIDTIQRYENLRNSDAYKNAEKSKEDFDNLYAEVTRLNKNNKSQKTNFVPVFLEDTLVWNIIHKRGDIGGHSVLFNCFRENQSIDWFVNAVMEEIDKENVEGSAIERALVRLIKFLNYDDTANMSYDVIRNTLLAPKKQFPHNNFKDIYSNDPYFKETLKMLFEAFGYEEVLPEVGMYAMLEKVQLDFFSTARGSDIVVGEPDHGSDSEFEDEITYDHKLSWDLEKPIFEEPQAYSTKIYHEKRRVCAGMKAIVVAHYGLLSYLRTKNEKAYEKDVKQMYYEVEMGLPAVRVEDIKENKKRAEANSCILHYDLNYCNAGNLPIIYSLKEKIEELRPTLIVLDYTSATYKTVNEAIDRCFCYSNIQVIILVNSGLKNDQGGADINPYGEVRVIAREKVTTKNILSYIEKGLSEKDKLPQKVHELARACKERGIGFSLMGNRMGIAERFETFEPELDAPQNRLTR